MTKSTENYLKVIYTSKTDKTKAINATKVAEELDISNAAVTEMSKKLSGQGLIKYTKYKGLELTKEGEKAALKVVRKHRLWEKFLMESLGLSWSEVHEEAERLEHIGSDFLVDKIDEYLGNPEFDPHGEPIPRKNGEIPLLPEFISLSEAVVGKKYKVLKVSDKNKDLVSYLTKIGVELNSQLKIVERLIFDNSLVVTLNNDNYSLSSFVALNIFVVEI